MTYTNNNIGWISSVDGFMNPDTVSDEEFVPRIRLDDYIDKRVSKAPKLIKIDVEGAEYFVLRGLANFFNLGHRPVIICETAPNSFQHFGKNIEDLVVYMTEYGYSASLIDGSSVDVNKLTMTTDVVWRVQA